MLKANANALQHQTDIERLLLVKVQEALAVRTRVDPLHEGFVVLVIADTGDETMLDSASMVFGNIPMGMLHEELVSSSFEEDPFANPIRLTRIEANKRGFFDMPTCTRRIRSLGEV